MKKTMIITILIGLMLVISNAYAAVDQENRNLVISGRNTFLKSLNQPAIVDDFKSIIETTKF